jgi:hypothetical protein
LTALFFATTLDGGVAFFAAGVILIFASLVSPQLVLGLPPRGQ